MQYIYQRRDGIINEYITEDNLNCFYMNNNGDRYHFTINSLKAEGEVSNKLIDLIEVGDFVNGKQIDYILTPETENAETLLLYNQDMSIEDMFKYSIKENEIETVLTKEQFELYRLTKGRIRWL